MSQKIAQFNVHPVSTHQLLNFASSLILAGNLQVTVIASCVFVLVGLFLTTMILFTKAKLVKHVPCNLSINDDAALTKKTVGGVTLLTALTQNGIAIPSPCGGKATCKQCRVRVLKGGGAPLETDRATFTQKQLQEGWRLSCQCKVREDMAVTIHPHLLQVKQWEATVTRNEHVATFIRELVVEVPEEIPYRSGGYLQFHVPPFQTNTNDWAVGMDPRYHESWQQLGLMGISLDFRGLSGEIIRAYSLASYPAEGKRLMFNIRIATPPLIKGVVAKGIPWGICSSYAFSLKPGDKLRLSGPYGESFMIEDQRELIFLIGGAGSSFSRSHILHLFRTQQTTRKVTLWYGARSLRENIYQNEYEQLQQEAPNFSYRLVLSEPLAEDLQRGWPKNDPLKTNFLFRAFELGQLRQMEEPEDCLYYVCGPPLHNTSILKLLDDYGVSRQSIILDDFGS